MNKNGKMLIALAIITSLCITPAVYLPNDNASGELSSDVMLGDYEISQAKADEIKEKVIDVSSVESFSSIGTNRIVEINASLSNSFNASEYQEALENCILAGKPVVSLDGATAFTAPEFDIPTAFVTDATATGVYYNNSTGAISCYSVKCDSQTEAANRVYAWADEMLSADVDSADNVALSSANGSPSWGSEIQSYADIECGDYGWFYIRTNYFEQITSSNTYRYYKPDYSLQAVPNSSTNARIADMNVQCDVDKLRNTQRLLDYGPTTTSGSSTASVSLNWSVSESGASIGMSTERSYSISDIMVHDYSNFGNELFSTSHDVQESGSVGDTTILIKPGLVSSSEKSNSNGGYSVEDNYSVNFCKYQKSGNLPWSEYTCQNYHLFYTTLNVNIP